MMRFRISMSSMSSKRAHIVAPALFTSASRRPKATSAPAMIAWQSRSVVTSAFTVTTDAPSFLQAAATSSSSFSLRAASTSFEPLAASWRASSAPMPLDAPVITTTLSFIDAPLGPLDSCLRRNDLFVRLGIGNVVERDVQPAAIARLVGLCEVHRLLAEARVELVEGRIEALRLVLGGEEAAGMHRLRDEVRVGH